VGAARQEWNRWKRENAPWWSGVSCAPQEAFRDLERALENWKAERARFPQWPVVNPLRGERDDDGLRNGQRPLNSYPFTLIPSSQATSGRGYACEP